MENKIDFLDPSDEVRKLQDKVRKLEFQNEQLRSQHSRNGLIRKKIVLSVSGENCVVDADQQDKAMDEYDIIITRDEDFMDEERWLYVPPNSVPRNIAGNLLTWLWQDVDTNDNEFQLMKRKLIQDLEEMEQGSRRNSIDTRTFTRSKKRLGRPSLVTMVETPVHGNRKSLLSPWRTPDVQNMDDTDISLSFNSTFGPLATESLLLGANFHRDESLEFNTLLQKIASEPHLNLTSGSRRATFQKTASATSDFHSSYQKLSEPDLNATFLKVSDPCTLNHQKSAEMNATFQLSPRSRSITPSGLNSTFSVREGGSNRSVRAASCDSGGDDDQFSSASDSSFSSCNRLMNVGDVQNIARLQEESLKQVMSTPKNNFKREGAVPGIEEDLPSPIPKDYNHGYHSDHSDHSSSADGRARSSRSSLKSSPGGSPFGSTQILTNVPEIVPRNTAVGLPRRNLKLIPPGMQEAPKLQTAVKCVESVQGGPIRSVSGLRPPTVRSQGVMPSTTGVPLQRRGSNIPRPSSRIPAPRIRTGAYSSSQPAAKPDWTDRCS